MQGACEKNAPPAPPLATGMVKKHLFIFGIFLLPYLAFFIPVGVFLVAQIRQEKCAHAAYSHKHVRSPCFIFQNVTNRKQTSKKVWSEIILLAHSPTFLLC